MTARARTLLVFVGVAAVSAAATPFRPVPGVTQGRASADTSRPSITLLYQNFPNPFPTGASRTTCIWFDLSSRSTVSLTIHDVRGNLVRQILPNASGPAFLNPGRYGRGSDTADAGCDPAYAWDGTADNGATVPRGVYLIRLRAARTQSIKKAVFQGP